MITYATKLWQGTLDALARHPEADLVITNNTHAKIIDIGKTDPYFSPELEAVKRCKTKYILWYSGDVIPPTTDWVAEALPYLDKYPIVTCMDKLSVFPGGIEENFETYHFSDQCYIAKAKYMWNIDYDTTHRIAIDYPEHGGNSFERRVAQYLSNQGTPLLVLANHRYEHLIKENTDG